MLRAFLWREVVSLRISRGESMRGLFLFCAGVSAT